MYLPITPPPSNRHCMYLYSTDTPVVDESVLDSKKNNRNHTFQLDTIVISSRPHVIPPSIDNPQRLLVLTCATPSHVTPTLPTPSRAMWLILVASPSPARSWTDTHPFDHDRVSLQVDRGTVRNRRGANGVTRPITRRPKVQRDTLRVPRPALPFFFCGRRVWSVATACMRWRRHAARVHVLISPVDKHVGSTSVPPVVNAYSKKKKRERVLSKMSHRHVSRRPHPGRRVTRAFEIRVHRLIDGLKPRQSPLRPSYWRGRAGCIHSQPIFRFRPLFNCAAVVDHARRVRHVVPLLPLTVLQCLFGNLNTSSSPLSHTDRLQGH